MNTSTQKKQEDGQNGFTVAGMVPQASGMASEMGSGPPQTDIGPNGIDAVSHKEGTLAKTIENQTARLSSDTFLWAAIGGMAASAALEFTGHKDKSRFVGQWVAPLLLFGIYNKLVKQHGSDKTEQTA